MSDMQKDLVLSINEYAYVLDKTKGNVSCWVGPVKTSLSTSDTLVRFDTRTKSFMPCNYDEAISLFATAPENWYIILKNPIENDKHPTPGTANSLPEHVNVGRKVNIRGPVTFALYPGQMAKVVRGHALRSNQYLLARVYEAESASNSEGEAVDQDGNRIMTKQSYVNGQLLVIKGTEVSFYIPPTGIEVIPINNDPSCGYVREAVTLERLEYCILKDEDGNKRYVHGPEVVFPEPTETFVTSPNNSFIFRAIELSKISGIYVKVIAAYDDKDETGAVIAHHPVGEELFITGADQMIYYPRPEHAIINYDNKIMHHAIAIPRGEGRYIMNRMTGEIKTVQGPAMYLPDPRYEVVVQRKLSEKQCRLWYPGNDAALQYNMALNEKVVEKRTAQKTNLDVLASMTSYSAQSTLANLEAKANISRGTSYTKPRTITLDNKFDGVVTIEVWTGYAVNVISKDGSRHIVKGPQTILLDYDQTLEVLELSTGRPKSTDKLIKTVYLRHENNKVSDYVTVETKDFVSVGIKVSYCVDFDPEDTDKWFSIENYVKYMTDRERSLLKREAKKYTIEEFYQNYADIVRNIAINAPDKPTENKGKPRRYFPENGMYVHDCEVLGIDVEVEIAEMMEDHQRDMVRESLRLNAAEKRVLVTEKLVINEKKEAELKTQMALQKIALAQKENEERIAAKAAIARKEEAEAQAAKQAEKDLDVLKDALHEAELARKKRESEAVLDEKRKLAEIDKAKQETYAATVNKIVEAIGPDLVAALTSRANADMMEAVSGAMSPVAIAKGESVADVVNKLLRGTSLEGVLESMKH